MKTILYALDAVFDDMNQSQRFFASSRNAKYGNLALC